MSTCQMFIGSETKTNRIMRSKHVGNKHLGISFSFLHTISLSENANATVYIFFQHLDRQIAIF